MDRNDSGAWAVGLWNALVPPGSEVIVRRDDGEAEGGVTRSVAWQLGDGTPVVKIEGEAGGYLLWRVEPSNRLLWQLGHSAPVMEQLRAEVTRLEAERDRLAESVARLRAAKNMVYHLQADWPDDDTPGPDEVYLDDEGPEEPPVRISVCVSRVLEEALRRQRRQIETEWGTEGKPIFVELLRSRYHGKLAVSVGDIGHGPEGSPYEVIGRWPLDPRARQAMGEQAFADGFVRARDHFGGRLEKLAQQLAATQRQAQALEQDANRGYRIHGYWSDGEDAENLVPDKIVLVAEDEGPVPFWALNGMPLIGELLRRQARQWVRAAEDGEGPPLEALLALVPPDLQLESQPGIFNSHPCWAGFVEGGDLKAGAYGPTRTAAIRAATLRLLGIEQQPDGPGLPGVRVVGNLVSATPEEGDDE